MNSQNHSPLEAVIINRQVMKALIAALLSVSSAILVSAQSIALGSRFVVAPNIGNKEGVASINNETWAEIKFLDSRGTHAPAPSNIKVILTITVMSDLTAAKKVAEWHTRNPLDKSNVVLPKEKDAVVIQGDFLAGWKSVWVGVTSERGGAVRVFVEGERVITGNTVINVRGPNKLAITVNPSSIPLSSYAKVEISLLDYDNSNVSADSDYKITVTATALVSLKQAARASSAQQSLRSRSLLRSLDGQQIVLQRGQTTATLTGLIQKNKSKVSLRFKSGFPGTVRLYVQGEGLFPAGTPVAVTAAYSQLLPDDSFKQLSMPARPARMMPALWQPDGTAPVPSQPALPLKLKIEGFNVTEEIRDTFRFKVFLYDQNDQPVNAPEDVVINLKLDTPKGKAEVAPQTLLIPKDKSLNERPVEVKSSCDRELTIQAEAQIPGINSVSEKLSFNPPRRATMLDVQAVPVRQVASGWNSISMRVSALNDCSEPIRAEEENLGAGRPIAFSYESALRLDGDNDALTIPAGSYSEAKKVFSSDSGKFRVVATDQSNRQVSWAGEISFYFPWREFLSAIVGGLLWPLISSLPKLLWKTLAQGAVAGAIGFGLALFGAIVTEQAKLGELTINLLRLPMTSWLPAGIMGFVGYLLISGALSIPPMIKKALHKGTGTESDSE